MEENKEIENQFTEDDYKNTRNYKMVYRTKKSKIFSVEDRVLFLNMFGKNYSNLSDKQRVFLEKYGFKNIDKRFFENFSPREIYQSLSGKYNNFEDFFKYKKQYEKFGGVVLEYLSNKGFDIFQIPNHFDRNDFPKVICKFFNKTKEEFDFYKLGMAMCKIFGRKFLCMNKNEREEFLKQYKSTPLFLKGKPIKHLMLFHNKNENEYKKFLLGEEFAKIHGFKYTCLTPENKEKVLNACKTVCKTNKLKQFCKFLDCGKGGIKEFEEELKFISYFGKSYKNLKAENKILLLRFTFEKFLEETKHYNNTGKDRIKFFLLEIKGHKFFTKNGLVCCPVCENKIIYTDRLRNLIKKGIFGDKLCTNCFKPKEFKTVSRKELMFLDYVKSIYKGKIIHSFKYEKEFEGRKDASKEFDIFLPDENIAIEYNGSYHHRNEKINHKYNYCTKNNINFIIVWEHNEDEGKEALNNLLNNKEFTEKTLILENMYYNLVPKNYKEIGVIKQTYKKVGKYRIYNLGKTKYERN